MSALRLPFDPGGLLLLEGGAEFGGQMALPDRRALALAGGPEVEVLIIPTAAAPDNNQRRAGENGRRWFSSLGARRVESLPLIDRSSAEDPALAERLRRAKLIYLLGGFPGYLGHTLIGSACWQACLEAYQAGAVIAGSSAGAMVLCEHYFDPESGEIMPGLNLLPGACVLPHHNTFGKSWAPRLTERLPSITLLGIDEQTGMIHVPGHGWEILGKGEVRMYS